MAGNNHQDNANAMEMFQLNLFVERRVIDWTLTSQKHFDSGGATMALRAGMWLVEEPPRAIRTCKRALTKKDVRLPYLL